MPIIDNIEFRSYNNKSAYKQYKNIKNYESGSDFAKNIININTIFIKQLAENKLSFTNRNIITD